MSLFKALFCQLMSAWLIMQLPWIEVTTHHRLVLQSTFSATLSILIRQPRWWIPIHLGFWPTFIWTQKLALPPPFYFGALLAMLLVFWGTFKGDVPLFLSSPAVADALSDLIEEEQSTLLLELGAGIGSVVVPLAIRHPNLRITAIERAPLPWLILRWRCRALNNVEVMRQNIWHVDLVPYTMVYAFLSPIVMKRLATKVSAEMAPGSLLISSSFPIPDWPTKNRLKLDDRRQTILYGYRINNRSIDADVP